MPTGKEIPLREKESLRGNTADYIADDFFTPPPPSRVGKAADFGVNKMQDLCANRTVIYTAVPVANHNSPPLQ
ncbi:Uncharacterized protein APZ42_029082 [Daphnia magna]|uniref:Uncharacterized protein n=1 Tax=Daphnia magna TaxID=35525 RepID=A0A164PXW0_9CRUS|nr:Uncharacterized protein APZ42_029082 [Daphnia magna]